MDKTIVHFEIPAKDPEKLKKFYEDLFGWKIEKVPGPMEYYMIYTVPVDENQMPIRPGLNGGMYIKEEPNQIPVNYVSVDDIDAHIFKLKELGGKTVYDKVQVPGVGYVYIGKDPEGNQVAFMQPEM